MRNDHIAFLILAVLMLVAHTSYAFRLFVENKSPEPITIEHESGQKLVINPGSFVEERFINNSIIRCLVHNEERCTWSVNKYEGPGRRMIGIGYGNYGDGLECRSFSTEIEDFTAEINKH